MKALNRVPDWLKVVIIATIPRLLTLGSESLWYDEAYTAWLSGGRLSFDQMWQANLNDVHPPTWYLIEWITVRLFGSNSEFVLRLPSLIFSVISILLLWQIAIALFRNAALDKSTNWLERDRNWNTGARSAWYVVLIASLLPGAIYYGQEARAYSLLCCFVYLMILGGFRRNWIMLIIGGIGTVYSQNLGVVYVLVIGGVLLLQHRHGGWLKIGAALGCVVLGWLPWLPSALYQARNVGDGFWMWRPMPGGYLLPFANLTLAMRAPAGLLPILIAIVFLATFAGVLISYKWIFTRRGILVLAAAFGVPTLLAVISTVWTPVYLPRALLPSILLSTVFWAYPMARASTPNLKLFRAVVLIALLLASAAYFYPGNGRKNVPALLQPMVSQWRQGDVIYFTNPYTAVWIGYYTADKPYVVRDSHSDLSASLTDATIEAMGIKLATFSQAQQIAAQQGGRVWVISYTTPMTKLDEFADLLLILVQRTTTPIFWEWSVQKQLTIVRSG